MKNQANKVYQWEDKYIAPFDKSQVEYKNIQSLINYVWENEGLKYPPQVNPLHKNNRKALAKGSRLDVYFSVDKKYPTWVILHELSHSLTMTVEHSNGHQDDFVGVYMRLLSKYIDIPMTLLTYTASISGIKYNTQARYWCVR